MFPIEVDGHPREIGPGRTVLDACRLANVHVPTFCHSDRMPSGGHCRACLVELDGRLVAACTTPVRENAKILTNTERLRQYRRDLGELMWTEAHPGSLEDTLTSWGVTGLRYRHAHHLKVSDASHPYLRLDLSSCIRCRLCERACDAIAGKSVFAFTHRGAETRLAWGPEGLPFVDSPCVACGACTSVCPTGAVTDIDRIRANITTEYRKIRTTCGYCGVGCQLEVHIGEDDSDNHLPNPDNDRILRIDGVENAVVNRGHLCLKGRYAHAFTRHPDRLTTPLIRRDGKLEPATWDEALSLVVERFSDLRGAIGALSSSRCTNEENFLLQKWMRAGFSTHNVDCCARVCHAPTAAGMKRSFGTGAATNSLSDIESSDLLLVSGSNSTEAHPVTGARIVQQVLRGLAKLIVIDPRETELARLADVHLQLVPGTNVPLLNSLAYCLVKLGLVDHTSIRDRTHGFREFVTFIENYSPENTEPVTHVPAALAWKAAELYGRARRPMQTHGLGMTEHFQGSESVMQLCNLALLVGAIGRKGVGVNPLRGQNNVQGAADMGCQPDALTGYQNPDDPEVRKHFESIWGAPLPTAPGLMLPQMYDAARDGRLRGLFILGEDVVQTDPKVHVDEALTRLDFLVVEELFLTETAKRAHVVLPGASFLEKDGTFTNGERRIQRVRKCLEPPTGARPDWHILLELMARTGMSQSLSTPSEIYAEIASVAPIFAGVDFSRLDGDGLQWPVPSLDHPGTPRLHTEAFPIGRAKFAQAPFTPSPALEFLGDAYPLRLITGRILEHYNCGSMTRRTDNLLLQNGDLLELSPQDATRCNLFDGDKVLVKSPWGSARTRLSISERVPPGTTFLSFHHPDTDTNALMSPVLDQLASCPEYKVTPVRIDRVSEPPVSEPEASPRDELRPAYLEF